MAGLKILFVIPEFNRRAGLSRHGANLAVALARRGNEVTVLARHVDAQPGDESIRFETYRVMERSPAFVVATEAIASTRAARRLAKGFDVVLSLCVPVMASTVHIGMGSHRFYWTSRWRTSRPTSLHGWLELMRPFHFIILFWEWLLLRRPYPRLVVVAGEEIAKEYPRHYKYPAERTVVVPLGVEHDEFTFDPDLRESTRSRLGISPKTNLLLEVAHSSGRKNLETVIRALELLPDGDWVFALAGDACFLPQVQQMTARLRERGRVKLLGSVPNAEIPHVRALYCAADLFVLASLYEGWAMVVTEALACGTPVLVSESTPSSVAIRPGENGDIIDDPLDPDEIAEKLERLMNRGSDRARVAESVDWLSWDNSAGMLEVHLRRVAAGEVGDLR